MFGKAKGKVIDIASAAAAAAQRRNSRSQRDRRGSKEGTLVSPLSRSKSIADEIQRVDSLSKGQGRIDRHKHKRGPPRARTHHPALASVAAQAAAGGRSRAQSKTAEVEEAVPKEVDTERPDQESAPPTILTTANGHHIVDEDTDDEYADAIDICEAAGCGEGAEVEGRCFRHFFQGTVDSQSYTADGAASGKAKSNAAKTTEKVPPNDNTTTASPPASDAGEASPAPSTAPLARVASSGSIGSSTSTMSSSNLAQRAAAELLSTELTYVKGLKSLVKYIMRPLNILRDMGREVISKSDIEIIFSKLPELLTLHKNLHADLAKLQAAGAPVNTLGHSLLVYTPFFRMYIDYVSEYDKRLETLRKLRRTDAQARFFFDFHGRILESDVESLMILPVQRIPRYLLLLEQIIKGTPEMDRGKEIVQALDEIKKVAVVINESFQKREARQKVVELDRRLRNLSAAMSVDPHGDAAFGKNDTAVSSLMSPTRYYVREGVMFKKYARYRFLHWDAYHPLFFVLFNDMLLVTQRQRHLSSLGGNLSAKYALPLAGMQIIEAEVAAQAEKSQHERRRKMQKVHRAKNNGRFAFFIRTKSLAQPMKVYCPAPALRTEWTRALRKHIAACDIQAAKLEGHDLPPTIPRNRPRRRLSETERRAREKKKTEVKSDVKLQVVSEEEGETEVLVPAVPETPKLSRVDTGEADKVPSVPAVESPDSAAEAHAAHSPVQQSDSSPSAPLPGQVEAESAPVSPEEVEPKPKGLLAWAADRLVPWVSPTRGDEEEEEEEEDVEEEEEEEEDVLADSESDKDQDAPPTTENDSDFASAFSGGGRSSLESGASAMAATGRLSAPPLPVSRPRRSVGGSGLPSPVSSNISLQEKPSSPVSSAASDVFGGAAAQARGHHRRTGSRPPPRRAPPSVGGTKVAVTVSSDQGSEAVSVAAPDTPARPAVEQEGDDDDASEARSKGFSSPAASTDVSELEFV